MSEDQSTESTEADNATEADQRNADQAQEADGDNDEDDDEKFDAAAARRRLDKAQREAKNLRERIKALEPLAQEADKTRKAQQTEAQRLTEEKAELEVRLAELTTANVRRDAAEAAGLPARFVKFITAADADEALAQAKELAKELKPAEEKKADLRQGARGANASGSSQNADDLLRQMARQR